MIVLYLVLSLGGLLGHAISDAVTDSLTVKKINLDHAEPLKDFWHLMKWCRRIGLSLFWVFLVVFCYEFDWDLWTLASLPLFLLVYIYILKDKVWNHFFKRLDLRWKYMQLENTMRITTGSKKLDMWLGLHQ